MIKVDFANARFKATFDGEKISMSGALTDVTTFEALQGLTSEPSDIDISQLQVASYAGLAALLEHLDQLEIDHRLTSIPFPIYAMLVLHGGTKYIKTFERVLVSYENGVIKKSTDLVEFTDESTALNIGDQLNLLSPSFIGYPSPFERGFRSNWASDMPEEAAFWQDYFGFFFNTVNQVEQNLASSLLALNRLLGLINIRVTSFSDAWEKMNLPDRKGNWTGDAGIKASEELSENLIKITTKMNIVGQKILSAILLALNHDEVKITEGLELLNEFEQYQKECSAILESHGSSLGDILTSIESFKNLEEDLNTGLGNLPLEELPDILDALGIMSFDAEDDPEIAATEITDEAKLAEDDIMSCIVILQAFDLVSQTLKNRSNELSEIMNLLNSYKSQEIEWTVLRDKITEMFLEKFSTGPEKSTFNFYLGYLEAVKNQTEETTVQEYLFF